MWLTRASRRSLIALGSVPLLQRPAVAQRSEAFPNR
ncbi:MAG: hypothetical protein JWQ72_2280, partial [Polaromonas sp.]|nr:hypothetical protein [Polaromonas sp.]